MKRLTYRDNEGRAQWAPELLEDNTGMAGSVIRSFVADVEGILGGRSRSESVKRCSISGKAETISDYGKFKIPPPAGTKGKERPSYMDLYQRLTAIEDILGEEYDLDELREMVQVKRDGRCVVLPCKIDDDVYINLFGRTLDATVISISELASTPTYKAMYGIRLCYIFKADDVGRTVFLTREAAEEALKAREQE